MERLENSKPTRLSNKRKLQNARERFRNLKMRISLLKDMLPENTRHRPHERKHMNLLDTVRKASRYIQVLRETLEINNATLQKFEHLTIV